MGFFGLQPNGSATTAPRALLPAAAVLMAGDAIR